MEENKRTYPCDEPENKKTGRIYPCDEPENKNTDTDAAMPERSAEAPKGKGKRGGNSGFSVVKHSGNFKERVQRENRFGESRKFDRENAEDGSDRFDKDYQRDFKKDFHRDDRKDRGEKFEHGFGSRVHSENSVFRNSERRADDRRDGRFDRSRSDDLSGGRNFDRYSARGSDRRYDRRDQAQENRNERNGADKRGGRDNSFGTGRRGRDDAFRSDKRGGRDSRDGFTKRIVNEQDFSDPFDLKIIEANEYGAFVELPAGALTKKISGITVSGNFLGDAAGEQSQRVLVPFAEQIGRPGRGETIRVRFYADKSGRMTATMREPILNDGEVGILKVADVTSIGIFLDNGVPKQVLLPFREQIEKPEVGDDVLVYLYRDKSQRQAATMRVYKHLEKFGPYKEDDRVTGFVYEINEDLGVFVAVDNKYYGMIPIRETFRKYSYGEKIEARVSKVREDGKMDLLVRDKLYLSVDTDADAILYELRRNGGFLPYGDRADADFIEETYAMSKNQFKRALGHLFKNKKVEIDRENDTVRLIED